MKAIILVALILASCYAFEPFLFEEGHKFLDFLKDNDHRCFVLFIKNSDAGGRKVNQTVLDDRNDKQQYDLEARLVDEPNVSYAVIDIADPTMDSDTKADLDEFFLESRIDVSDLDSYPITAILDDGVGAYLWGPKQEILIHRIIDAFRTGRVGDPTN